VSGAGLPAADTPEPGRLARIVHRTFSSLSVRNFRYFFWGQLVSNTGNWLTNIALTLLVLHLTNSGLAVGLLTACQFGPILLLSAWAGAIADRSNKRNLLFVTQTGEMLQSITLAVLAFLPHPPLAALFAVAAVGGVLLAFDNPLRRSFVTEMVPPDERPNAVALYSAIVNTSRVFGPALAGLLVVTLGYGWAFALDAASYLTVLYALWRMRPSELLRVPTPDRARGQVRAGIRYVIRTPRLRISFVMLAIIGTLGYNLAVVLPLLVERALRGGDGAFTLVYATFSLGALVSALVVAGRRLVKIRHVVIGALGFGAAMLLLSIVPSVGFAVPAAFAVGLTSILYMTATTAIVQVEADPRMHGRILALQTVLMVGTAPIGGPFLGWLADVWGPRSTVVVGGVASIIAGVYGLLAVRRARTAAALSPAEPIADQVAVSVDR
jgi:MFS family permease